MAVKTAIIDGNWSNPAIWNDGTLPQPGDTCRPGGKSVTIDQNIDVLELTNGGGGGSFLVSSIPEGGMTLKCDINGFQHSTPALMVSATSGSLEILGAVRSGGASGAHGIRVEGAIALTAGDCIASPSGVSVAILVNAGGTSLNLQKVYGGRAAGVQMLVAGSIYCTAAIAHLNEGGHAIAATSAVVDLVIDGEVRSGISGYGVQASSSRSTPVVAKGPLHYGPSGRTPIWTNMLVVKSGSTQKSVTMRSASKYPLYGGEIYLTDTADNPPAPADVRAGVIYGESGELTGTLAMPTPDKVAANVPVDDTVGTASLDISEVVAVVGAQIASVVGE